MVRVSELQASLLSSLLWEQEDCEECKSCELYWPSNDACGWHLLSVVGCRFAYCLMFHLGKNLGSDSISSSDCSWTLQNSGLGDVCVLTGDKYNPGFGACCCCMSLYCPEYKCIQLYLCHSSEERFALLRLLSCVLTFCMCLQKGLKWLQCSSLDPYHLSDPQC